MSHSGKKELDNLKVSNRNLLWSESYAIIYHNLLLGG